MSPKMLLYHPVRYGYQMQRFFEPVVAQWKTQCDPMKRGSHLLLSVMLEHAFKELISSQPEKVQGNVLEHVDWWGTHFEAMAGEFSDYRIRGENIFHFSEELIEMLRYTDIDQVTFDLLRFPFKAFYIHFERSIPVTSLHSVDGVYVRDATFEEDPKAPALFLTFTSVRGGVDQTVRRELLEFLLDDPFYDFMLCFDQGENVGAALASALKIEVEGPGGLDYDYAVDWLRIAKPLTQLAMNCLLYLSYEGRDVEYRFPASAPEKFVRAATSAERPTERSRGESKLYSLGFRKIHFCGTSFAHHFEDERRTRGEMTPHWRRGHWRNQLHGTGRALRRLVWIRPTVVRADKGPPVPKHLYVTPDKTGHRT